jgi:hypothetical protein
MSDARVDELRMAGIIQTDADAPGPERRTQSPL